MPVVEGYLGELPDDHPQVGRLLTVQRAVQLRVGRALRHHERHGFPLMGLWACGRRGRHRPRTHPTRTSRATTRGHRGRHWRQYRPGTLDGFIAAPARPSTIQRHPDKPKSVGSLRQRGSDPRFLRIAEVRRRLLDLFSAPALVFVHHWGGFADTWNDVIGDLPPGRVTVRFDRRDWGASQALPGPHHLVQPADDLGSRREARSTLRPVRRSVRRSENVIRPAVWRAPCFPERCAPAGSISVPAG